MRLTSPRSLRFAQAIVLYVYAALIALATGVTWLNPLPDPTGLGQAVFNLQVVPCAVIGSIALVDALLPGRMRLVRWAADLGSVVAVWVVLLFAFALALINLSFAIGPLLFGLVLLVTVLESVGVRVRRR
jgi:hypothetical protein